MQQIKLINEINIKSEVDISEQISELEKLLLMNSKLEGLAKIEVWTALGTNKQISYATHGLYRYFGKFPAPIARKLIISYSKEGDEILDVMAGSGTTGVEALLLNRKAILYDVNPLSRLIAKVKTTVIDKSKLLFEYEKIKTLYKPLTYDEYPFNPIGLKNTTHWFYEETINSLRGIKKLIDSINDISTKEFAEVVFVSIVRNVSKATTQQGRLFLDINSAKLDALDIFLKKYLKAIEMLDELPNVNNVKVKEHNLKIPFNEIEYGKRNLIIAHPPYFNSYKYSSINSLELSWLGVDHADVRKEEVKEFFKVGKKEKVSFYVEDMVKCFNNVFPLLKKDGVFAVMIGDTIIKEEYIPVTKLILEKLELKDIQLEKIILRKPQYTEATWAASQRRNKNNLGVVLYDFILIFRRIK